MQASFTVIDRETAILVNEITDKEGWAVVTVDLGDGLGLEDLDGEGVMTLQSEDEKTILFRRFPEEDFDEKIEEWEGQGLFVCGGGTVEFFQTMAEYEASDLYEA